MDDVMKQKKAKEMFLSICQALDSEGWRYKKNEEDLTITSGFAGEDLPIEFTIAVDVGLQLIQIRSPMAYKMEEEKRIDGAIAISALNSTLVNGCFDYDILDGSIYFRIETTFWDSLISREAILYLLYFACKVVDVYNDKLLMLSKDALDLKQFLQEINQ